jgi:hypothetical protein
MRRAVALAATVGALIVAVVVMLVWRREAQSRSEALQPVPGAAKPMARTSTEVSAELPSRSRPPEPPAPRGLTAEEKAARIEKIKRDYDEIRTKTSADYTAAGAVFPGGLNAFLRQLALLEREKRADLAAVLSPQELEELEMHETAAGQNVERLLGPTHATVEQRRTVFRLQREFEDKFALTFDLTPRALLEREAARQQVQEQIRAVLGDDLFGSWLFGEGEDYALFVAFAARHNLPPTAPLELRQLKNEYALRRLELNAAKNMTEDQRRVARAELARQTEARVMSIIGQNALQAGRKDILSWLPKK